LKGRQFNPGKDSQENPVTSRTEKAGGKKDKKGELGLEQINKKTGGITTTGNKASVSKKWNGIRGSSGTFQIKALGPKQSHL